MGSSIQSGGGGRRGRGRRTGSGYRAMAEINVTPMVDVMLVLLIIFMVSAPLLSAGVPVDLPNSKAKPIADQDNKPIEITVDKDGKVYLGETEVKDGNLVPMLSAMLEGNDDRRIYIRGDQTLAYGKVMEIIGLIGGAGFTKVALISKPKQ
ncbi:MAG: protein TolR [Alphaproteobacteria bacterium]|nr:protein TolR [Alphaproteobacteria bacterium]